MAELTHKKTSKKTSKKALGIFKTLTEEQKQFALTNKISASYKIKKWLDLLQKLAIMDKLGDKQRKRSKGWAIAFLIFAGFFTLLTFGGGFFMLIMVAIFAVPGFLLLSRYKKLKKIDIDNRLRLFVVPLTIILLEEANKEKKITYNLNVKNPVRKDNISEIIPNTNKRYPKIKTTFYKSEWMEASAEFSDGVKLNWDIEDVIRKRNITKISRSGKTKYKVKYKIKHIINMQVQLPKSKYQLTADPTSFLYKDSNNYHVLKIKGKAISNSLVQGLDINAFLELVASAYSKFKPI